MPPLTARQKHKGKALTNTSFLGGDAKDFPEKDQISKKIEIFKTFISAPVYS